MSYLYLKALHIIFVVTWFAGLFYMPRLFIYNTEANEKEPAVQQALHNQFAVMMKGLWFGITWPSAILTLIFGLLVLHFGGWEPVLFTRPGRWLLVKLCFVLLLYGYHFSMHKIFNQQMHGIFKYSSQQLRIWNEVATVFLVAIVMLATVKQSISFVWGLIGLVCFVVVLMSAIKVYKIIREKNKKP
ncbi:CopD family protein [Parafilimonas sp.]|uniref:CopD family protein n=1 Tax=Parafilimonas sp. TaxID=1969739 RepID=UPI0039E2A3FA